MRGVHVRACLLLAAILLLSCRTTRESASHDDVFTNEGLLAVNAKDLKSTQVTAILDESITEGQSTVWCSTFQLAWDELCEAHGESIRLEGEPRMAVELNRRLAGKGDLDEASYVAVGGFGPGVVDKMTLALDKKFKGTARPRLIPDPRGLTKNHAVGYAYLFKNLEFAVPFQRITTALDFGGIEVRCFGKEGEKIPTEGMLEQVKVWYEFGTDEFIVEISPKSKGDRIVLAKTRPGTTLLDAIEKTHKRMSEREPGAMGSCDELKIPKFNFDVNREYTEVEGKWFITADGRHDPEDRLMVNAEQIIRFQMDEKGVRLRSEARAVSFTCSVTPVGRRLVFDKPFLFMLEREEAKMPYFAMWVDNAELMVKK